MFGPRHARARSWAFGLLIGVALVPGQQVYAADENNPAWRAAHQLMGAQLPSGEFGFDHDFVTGGRRPTSPVAYVTREAGTAYELSSYFLYDKDADVARALLLALRKLRDLSLPIAKASGQGVLESTGILALPFARYKLHDALQWLGLLYSPNGEGRLVSYDRSYETAWGAATAFSLLTELQFYRASRDAEFASLRQAWLRGLLVLYDGRGGFRKVPGSIDEDDLSNAEIWLALAYYTRLFPNDRATAAIVAQVDGYMMWTYSDRPNPDAYSFGIKAAEERLAATSDARFRRFIIEQTRIYLDRIGPPAGSTDNTCAMVEGLGTALRVLTATTDPDKGLIGRLQQRIDSEMGNNLSLQIQPGQTHIELGNGTYLSSPSVADYAGAFLAGTHEPYVRIDFTAHCISALLDLEH